MALPSFPCQFRGFVPWFLSIIRHFRPWKFPRTVREEDNNVMRSCRRNAISCDLSSRRRQGRISIVMKSRFFCLLTLLKTFFDSSLPCSESTFSSSSYLCSFSRGTQRQFSENICSEDDLISRIFGTFVVKFIACLVSPRIFEHPKNGIIAHF